MSNPKIKKLMNIINVRYNLFPFKTKYVPFGSDVIEEVDSLLPLYISKEGGVFEVQRPFKISSDS